MLPSYGRRVLGPRFDLAAFQAEVRAGNYHVYRTRALNVVRQLLHCSRDEATSFVKQVVLSLDAGDYAHTLAMSDGQAHDVYGKVIQEEGWYVKIEINLDDDQPGIVSCHPAEYDLATRKGIVPGKQR